MATFEFYTLNDKRKCAVSFGGTGEVALSTSVWIEFCNAMIDAIEIDKEAESETPKVQVKQAGMFD